MVRTQTLDKSGFQMVGNCAIVEWSMLTLESRCIPVVLGGVLILRTLPNL